MEHELAKIESTIQSIILMIERYTNILSGHLKNGTSLFGHTNIEDEIKELLNFKNSLEIYRQEIISKISNNVNEKFNNELFNMVISEYVKNIENAFHFFTTIIYILKDESELEVIKVELEEIEQTYVDLIALICEINKSNEYLIDINKGKLNVHFDMCIDINFNLNDLKDSLTEHKKNLLADLEEIKKYFLEINEPDEPDEPDDICGRRKKSEIKK